MRQLKGKVKETRKQRKERKLENMEIHNQMKTVVLPVLGLLALIIVAFVYVKTRPTFQYQKSIHRHRKSKKELEEKNILNECRKRLDGSTALNNSMWRSTISVQRAISQE
ncbi:hypothetical protein DOY81_004173 [Sarcophaga bullata]|nr:hypothetical protein DOY81_004173 [Sarcophaga bullata]